MEHTHMQIPLEIKATAVAGSFEGYGSIFGALDLDGDIMEKGAFIESLKKRMPALLWQHNTKEPIGRFDSVVEDDYGLKVKGRLSLEGRGKEAYDLLKMGALNGLSVGFVTKEASRNTGTGARHIKKADLMEISLVTFPASEDARISNLKTSTPLKTATAHKGSPHTDIRDFERFLRAHGFSRKHAKDIASHGFAPHGFAPHDIAPSSEMKDMALLRENLQARALKIQNSFE